MQKEAHAIDVRILVKVIDAAGVEGGSATNNAVHFIAFCQQQLREIRTVLPGDACDQCLFHVW